MVGEQLLLDLLIVVNLDLPRPGLGHSVAAFGLEQSIYEHSSDYILLLLKWLENTDCCYPAIC